MTLCTLNFVLGDGVVVQVGLVRGVLLLLLVLRVDTEQRVTQLHAIVFESSKLRDESKFTCISSLCKTLRTFSFIFIMDASHMDSSLPYFYIGHHETKRGPVSDELVQHAQDCGVNRIKICHHSSQLTIPV